LTDIDV